eukprot:jgi/Mesvir1/13553/Mv06364-RA.1
MPSDGTYRGIVGPQVTMERGAVAREEVTGPVRPDRLFEGEKMRAFNGERERDARLAPDILNRRYELPRTGCESTGPTRSRRTSIRALPITTYGRVQTHLRAGTRNRAPIPDFETGNRMRSDAETWTTSVLPERAAVLPTRENVSDAMDKGTPATWAPCRSRTRDAVEDAFQIGRFPLLDRSQLTAVAVGAPDMAQYNEERKERGSRDGERVMRMKQGDVSYDIDRETIARVYDPLEENPYFIPCVQVEGESIQ